MSPNPKKRHNRSSKRRTYSSVYSNLPSANINLGAMNVYAEVRGKYSRNANNTIQAPNIVSRPTTSGSLTTYNKRFVAEEPKDQPVEEPKTHRPVASEHKIVLKKRRYREKEHEADKSKDKNLEEKGEKNDKNDKNLENLEENSENPENDYEKDSSDDSSDEKRQEEADKVTEVSFKTTSSQKRYIEELENLLKEERLRRLKAEGELQRLSSRHSHRNS